MAGRKTLQCKLGFHRIAVGPEVTVGLWRSTQVPFQFLGKRKIRITYCKVCLEWSETEALNSARYHGTPNRLIGFNFRETKSPVPEKWRKV